MKIIEGGIREMFFGPREYKQVTVFTQDVQAIQFVANAKDEKDMAMISNVFKNADELGLTAVSSRIIGEENIFEDAVNVDESVLRLMKTKGLEKGFEKIAEKVGIDDAGITSALFNRIFSPETTIGKAGSKIIGKAFLLYDLYNKYEAYQELKERYSDPRTEDLRYIGYFLTRQHDNERVQSDLKYIKGLWSYWHGDGKLTFDVLAESCKSQAIERGYHIYEEMKNLVKFSTELLFIAL